MQSNRSLLGSPLSSNGLADPLDNHITDLGIHCSLDSLQVTKTLSLGQTCSLQLFLEDLIN